MNEKSSAPLPGAALHGLVLAGGYGSRLGTDKGALDYHGCPQARWAFELLHGLCEVRFVSMRADQAGEAAYRTLPVLIDPITDAGPAAGLLAAFTKHPGAAWLVIAADMPLLDRPLLARLVAARDSGALATAYRRSNGIPEPLCAIWEPRLLPVLQEAAPDLASVSLRRLLEAGPARLLEAAEDWRLTSVNTATDDALVRQRLAVQAASVM